MPARHALPWLLLAGSLSLPATAAPARAPGAEIVRVRRVIDGDTIVIENGARVRYIGVDAPEVHHPRRPVECLGKEATALNRRLVGGRTVRMERDVRNRDRYGRLLRYVYRRGRTGGFVNEEMILRGLSLARFYPPNLRERKKLLAAERRARKAKRGMWALFPSRPRGALRGMVLADPLGGVFHRPGTQGFENLRCARGARAFPSAPAAERAGMQEGPRQR